MQQRDGGALRRLVVDPESPTINVRSRVAPVDAIIASRPSGLAFAGRDRHRR